MRRSENSRHRKEANKGQVEEKKRGVSTNSGYSTWISLSARAALSCNTRMRKSRERKRKWKRETREQRETIEKEVRWKERQFIVDEAERKWRKKIFGKNRRRRKIESPS